ncbi:MAG: hypothetical protein D6736_15555 [Nitrospinota bacterium]|nr:MAG: hypothetical protein D6736_15555 [Nitrospinota bacterium]
MSNVQQLLEQYVKAVRFPDVSGFEILELLDIRSSLALRESELDEAQQAQLEEADSLFLHHIPLLYERISTLGPLSELRRRAAVPCSHWWWYLEKLVLREPIKG